MLLKLVPGTAAGGAPACRGLDVVTFNLICEYLWLELVSSQSPELKSNCACSFSIMLDLASAAVFRNTKTCLLRRNVPAGWKHWLVIGEIQPDRCDVSIILPNITEPEGDAEPPMLCRAEACTVNMTGPSAAAGQAVYWMATRSDKRHLEV